MKVNCPNCAKEVEWSPENEHRPFCSKKCQLIDLGEWAEEEKTISTPIGQQQQMKIDPEDIEAMLAQQEENFFKQ